MFTKPELLLRLEGALVLALSCYAYSLLHASWWLFALLFLVPDLAMLGYLANPRTGSAVYNTGHTLLVPVLLVVAAYVLNHPGWVPLAMIWLAHIGFDRLLGYGLKYPTFFKDTHLQHV
ncbi:MAG: DUF4260 domain-containing protein [Acidobacteriaceae bacterium]